MEKLLTAVSVTYPGTFQSLQEVNIDVWKCIGAMNMSLNAVLGRYLRIRDRGHRPLTASGQLWVQYGAMPCAATRAPSSLSLRLWISDAIGEVLQTRPYTCSCRVTRNFYSPTTGFPLLFCLLVRVVRQWCVKIPFLHWYRTSST